MLIINSVSKLTLMARLVLFLFLLSLALFSVVNCRVLSSVSELVSDGSQDGSEPDFLSLDPPNRLSKDACIHVYGFLPCADNIGGYVFQLFSFGSLLAIGEYFLTEGRSKLFLIFEVGFYGGVVLPMLRMFPRIVLILSTGFTGTREIANSMVGNTVGVTVGYTVFALTIQWGACVVFGLSGYDPRIEPVDSATPSLDAPRRRHFRMRMLKRLFQSSIQADSRNKPAAGIMLLTILPFIMITFSEIFDSQSWRDIIGLVTLIVSGSATLAYLVYSYFDEADQEKSLDHARYEIMSEVHKHLYHLRDGELSEERMKSLFDEIDVNKDGRIQKSELKNMRVKFEQLGGTKCDEHELTSKLLAYFDKNGDGEIDETEFRSGINKWVAEYKSSFNNNKCLASDGNSIEDVGVFKVVKTKESLIVKLFSKKALIGCSEIILGILIVMFLARPFMTNIELLSISAGVPSFYVVFAVLPLVRNLKHALSAHFCREKDKARITSDIFAEIYSEVTLNNLLGITSILAIVYVRGLTWDYSTEVVIVVIVGFLIGIPAYVRSTYPFWICVLAFALYFISLLLIYLHFST